MSSNELHTAGQEAISPSLAQADIILIDHIADLSYLVRNTPYDYGQTKALIADCLNNIISETSNPTVLATILAYTMLPKDNESYPAPESINDIADALRQSKIQFVPELTGIQTACERIISKPLLPQFRRGQKKQWEEKVRLLVDYFSRENNGPDLAERLCNILTSSSPMEQIKKRSEIMG